jgi:hypothetical protein
VSLTLSPTRFDACYGEATGQKAIFDQEIAPIVDCALQGHNASCFAFGPTGAGLFKMPQNRCVL